MEKEFVKNKVRASVGRIPHGEDIRKLALFGSYLREQPRPESDIDLLIEFTPDSKIGFFAMVDIQDFLQDELHKDVDLVTPEALSKYFRDEVMAEAETIYERR